MQRLRKMIGRAPGKSGIAAVLLLALAGCMTTGAEPASPEMLQTYDPGPIVTGGVGNARLTVRGGCLMLDYDRWQAIAFLPEGSVLETGGRAVALPDGTRIAIGRRYPMVLEFYPVLRNANPACAAVGEDLPLALVRSLEQP